ncbi:MAG: CvpA family protein [Planctomycetota bacterium]|jgi:uncharacterized membrane protein required for colicin V production
MWIANLVVVLIILACAVYQYLKGTLIKAFATMIIAICAGAVAFAYFEPFADVFLSRSDNSRFEAIVPWAQPLSFALLFILTFAILQTVAARLMRRPVHLGQLPERIGRVVCGLLLGLIVSGLLLAALAMAPLPNQYPYPRFDENRPDPQNPAKALLDADDVAAGIFGHTSNGCFRGKKSFDAFHPDFVDQAFLNRHSASKAVSIVTGADAIELPPQKGKQKGPIPSKSRHTLMIVRVGIKRSALKTAARFTLSQLRLICKEKAHADYPLSGKGKNVYPLGYIRAPNQLQIKKLTDQIELRHTDFDKKAAVRWIDFAFYVPNDFVPVLVQFKQNSVARVPPPVAAEEAPPTVSFSPLADRRKAAPKSKR